MSWVKFVGTFLCLIGYVQVWSFFKQCLLLVPVIATFMYVIKWTLNSQFFAAYGWQFKNVLSFYKFFFTVFVSVELAMIMDRLYGGVCYAGIDTDPELKYPKGAGRVAFSNQQSYIAAISARFVQLQHGEIDKRVGILYSLRISSW